jgi:hypothetical protein
VLVAHNGFTFDFKMLAACLLRAQQQQQQQQQQQRCGIPSDYGSSAGSDRSAADTHSNGASSSSSCSCSCCELPQGVLTLDSLVLVRRLQLKQQAGLANLQQGMQQQETSCYTIT